MKFAVRTAKIDIIKAQLFALLQLDEEDILASSTNYSGIMILNLNDSSAPTLKSIRHIEALLLSEKAAETLVKPAADGQLPSFRSLDGVDALDQYDHLRILMHMPNGSE